MTILARDGGRVGGHPRRTSRPPLLRRRFRPGSEPETLEPRLVLTTLPPGFQETAVVAGLTRPTTMAIAPDGRIFVAEQDGRLRVVTADGVLLDRPALTLSVANQGERGFVGLALDPNFARNGWVYVYRTIPAATPFNRISRFTISGDVVDPASERILLDLDRLHPRVAPIHNGGAMHFGRDGKLYVGVGDHHVARKAQRLDSLAGKILRINPDGSIPRDNPFDRSARGRFRAIWARGLRNPFTFAIQSTTGRMFINDVALSDHEEINLGRRGGNYGWPNVQGPRRAWGMTAPWFTYRHGDGPNAGCAITAGTFYHPVSAAFPSRFVGQYFFADYCNPWIKTIDPVTRRVSDFAVGVEHNVVDLDVGPDGALYYLARGEGYGENQGLGTIRRILYAPDRPARLAAELPAEILVAQGESATLTAEPAGTPPFAFQWQRDGQDLPDAHDRTYTTPPATEADDGARFRVIVANAFGSQVSAETTLRVSPFPPPTARIDEPPESLRYRRGQVITFAGEGLDVLGNPLPDDALLWHVELRHDDHVHPVVPPTRGIRRGTFTIPSFGEPPGRYSYRITLRVTDPSTGLTRTAVRAIYPRA